MRPDTQVTGIEAAAYRLPTDAEEADGTFAWTSTTMVIAHVSAGDRVGLGYTYAAAAAAEVIRDTLAPAIDGGDAFDTERLWQAMVGAVRNVGWRGIAATAISAVDMALWDLKARLLEIPLFRLLGAARVVVPIYGSGGFTSYDDARLRDQLGAWVTDAGCRAVKMKIGSEPERDPQRMLVAREAIGTAELMIDANGALSRKRALAVAEQAADLGVTWFEEPVSSDDLAGLRLLRDRAPPPVEIAAGEYGYDPFYFRRMLEAGSVDVLQADATRCGGYTGFLRAAALADAFALPLSAHTAPAIHLPVCCAAPRLRHLEWFHDHVRMERLLFEGAPEPAAGTIRPDDGRPGNGLELRRSAAEQIRASRAGRPISRASPPACGLGSV